MKSLDGLFGILLVLVFGATSAFAVNPTVVVREPNGIARTTVSTIPAAISAAQTGDTIDITSFDNGYVFDGGGAFVLNGVNLICSAGKNATIQRTATGNTWTGEFVDAQNNVQIKNINFLGRGSGYGSDWGMVAHATHNLTINNCEITNVAGPALWMRNSSSGQLNVQITNSIFVTGGTSVYTVSNTSATKPLVLLDHCTLISSNAYVFNIDLSCIANGCNGSEFTVKNTILVECSGGVGIGEQGGSAPTYPTYALNRSHNAFISGWVPYELFYPDGTEHFQYNLNTTGNPNTPYSDDVLLSSVNGVFNNLANGDYTVVSSSLIGHGENGSTIGANYSTFPVSATQFGMDYIPYIYGSDAMQFLCDRNWTTAGKAKVEADLNQMCSMGLTCQRLMFFGDGWELGNQWGSQNYQAPFFSSDFDEIIANLPDYIEMCAKRNITIDFCIGTPWLLGYASENPIVYYWQWAYGPNGWADYMDDYEYFVTSAVNAVESSPYGYTVHWYDINNEVFTTPFIDFYPGWLTTVWDSGWVPASKIGFSVLRVPPTGATDYDNLKNGDSDSTWLGTNRAAQAKLTDSHAYPEADTGDWNVALKYGKGHNDYPNSTTIVGEYAYSFTASGEATQATSEITLMNSMISAGIPYAMHWMFVDLYVPNQDPNAWKTGWFHNHDVNQPNDVVGAVGNKLGLFTNGDMEQGNSQFPTGWSGGSNGGHSLTFSRMNGTDCTGNYYYRIAASAAPDNIYSLSPYTAVPPCSNIYVNAYIRGGNTGNMYIGIHQYDAYGNHLSFTAGPSFSNGGNYQFYSYQQAVGGWVCPANPDTRYIYMGVVADINALPGWIDTDCVTLSVR